MNKTIAGVAAVVVVVGGIYYFAPNPSPSGTPVQPSTAETSAAPASPTSATTVAVNIQNFSFSPAALNVKTGTTVLWTNDDSATHTVTADSNGLFDSQAIAPGQSFSYTFTAPGTVSYHCAIHPSMKGSVTVTN